MTFRLVPLELEVAQRMVTAHHKHHKKPRGHLFSIGAEHMMTGDLAGATRKDEDGTCYKAAGWVPVAEVEGRPWTGGNKGQRWLPGLYEPTTEIVDRIRWEKRPTEAIKAVCKMVYALGQFANAWSRARRRAA